MFAFRHVGCEDVVKSAIFTDEHDEVLNGSAGVFFRLGLKCARERSEEHTSELQSHLNLVCRLLLEKKKNISSTDRRASRRAGATRLDALYLLSSRNTL